MNASNASTQSVCGFRSSTLKVHMIYRLPCPCVTSVMNVLSWLCRQAGRRADRQEHRQDASVSEERVLILQHHCVVSEWLQKWNICLFVCTEAFLSFGGVKCKPGLAAWLGTLSPLHSNSTACHTHAHKQKCQFLRFFHMLTWAKFGISKRLFLHRWSSLSAVQC